MTKSRFLEVNALGWGKPFALVVQSEDYLGNLVSWAFLKHVARIGLYVGGEDCSSVIPGLLLLFSIR